MPYSHTFPPPPPVAWPRVADEVDEVDVSRQAPHALLLADGALRAAAAAALPDTVAALPVSSLADAIAAAARGRCALVLVDPALCEGLAREFVEHLLRSSPVCEVLVVGDGGGTPAWAAHPRLEHVSASTLAAALQRWQRRRLAPAPGGTA